MPYNRSALLPGAARLVIALSLVLSVATDVSAIFPWESTGTGSLAFKAGAMGRADFVTSEDTTKTTIGASFGICADFPVYKRFRSGFSFDLHNIIALGQGRMMVDGSFTTKYDLVFDRAGVTVKPSAGIGFGILPEMGFMPVTYHLTLKAWLELHFHMSRKRAIMLEIGVWKAPGGGNSDIDVRIGPALFFRLGYVP